MSKLKEIRVARGLSQQGLANLAGLEYHTIYRLENGKQKPHRVVLRALAQALDVKPEELELR